MATSVHFRASDPAAEDLNSRELHVPSETWPPKTTKPPSGAQTVACPESATGRWLAMIVLECERESYTERVVTFKNFNSRFSRAFFECQRCVFIGDQPPLGCLTYRCTTVYIIVTTLTFITARGGGIGIRLYLSRKTSRGMYLNFFIW